MCYIYEKSEKISKNKEKVLVFFGSPHFDGNTEKLLNAVVSKTKQCFDFFRVDAYKIMASPCADCGYCKKNGTCHFDDLNKVYNLIKEVSKIFVATPIYNCSFPSPLKAIFDRFQLYFNLKNKKKINDKKVFLLLTCGRNADYTAVKNIFIQSEYIFKSINGKVISFSLLDGTDKKIITHEFVKKCSEGLVKNLLD